MRNLGNTKKKVDSYVGGMILKTGHKKNLNPVILIQVFNLQASCLARARSRSSRRSCYAKNTNWSTVLTPIIEKIKTAKE